ncbi:MAG: choice-of-anchor R domain-containing protein, partial [Terriglobales bacterium]
SMPFTPNSNAQVTQVRLALQYTGNGGDLFYVSIYADSGGNPGTLLAGPVTLRNLPLFGTCCTLAIAKFDEPLAVTGETRYWVVASTPTSGKGSDAWGSWDWVYQDGIPPVWLSDLPFEFPGSHSSAFEVLGTNE